jgi:DNA-binding transcriptional MocR family regulator
MDLALLEGWDGNPGTLPERLAQALERALVGGGLTGPLPAERRLAAALGVSRGSVTAAYALLKDRKLLTSRPGGYTQPDLAALAAPVRAARLAARGMGEATILRDYVERDPRALDLSFAFLDVPQDARSLVARAYASALDETPGTGYVAAGMPELRERIAESYTHGSGLKTSADQIIVTQGAYQAIGLTTLLALSPGDAVAVESPLYPGAVDIFRAHAAAIVEVGSFDDPRALDRLESAAARVTLVYATSAYRNPIGSAIDPRAAARLARWSARTDVPLVDDRALARCRISGTLPRPLAAYAPDAPILTLGSLDKTAGAGTRIGWIRAPRRLAPTLTRLKALSDLASPSFLQRVAIRLFDDLDAIAEARRAELQRHYAALEASLRLRLPHWRWLAPSGGASIWVDTGADADALARAAARAGVAVIPGAAFLPAGESGTHLRIAFARSEPEIAAAIERLAAVAAALPADRTRTKRRPRPTRR